VVAVESKMQKFVIVFFIVFLHSCVDNNTIVDKNNNKNQYKNKQKQDDKKLEKTTKKNINNKKLVAKTTIKKQKKQTNNYKNLWNEITNNLTLNEYKQKDIFWHVKWFKDNPAYLTRISKRAKPYLKMVLDEVKKQGLPYEIALLPIVESAYHPFAYSHGTASGMWQFIPSTAKLYGLKQNFWIDERRDPIRSTKAAISYLKSLHKFFKGNWYHAIAAYNSGPGRVKKAIEKNRKLGKPTDFWNLKLPKETVGYVPRLLAVAELFKNPQKYNQTITQISSKTVIGEVLLKSQLDLAVIAEWSGISIKKIYKLNSGLNQWATPNHRYHLILPIAKVNSFREKLKNYPKSKRIKWVRHKVKSGDSILYLAKKYSVSTKVIKELNKLNSNNIVKGKYLIIPVAGKDYSYYSHSQDQLTQKRLGKSGKKVIHTVKKGDSLWDISRKYGSSVKQIIKWNNLPSKTIINQGDVLVIWQKNPLKTSNLLKTIQTKNNIKKSITYTTRSGDNLSKIATKFKVRVEDIAKLNSLKINDSLKIGKKLKIEIDIKK
jgi:membrane-bound lytic murein transglycosylase D